MYMEWPESTLSTPGFEEVLDSDTGQLLLRGPRLRMGLSDGVPTSILPDHMGHANYTGALQWMQRSVAAVELRVLDTDLA